jgi:hypothetical protein
MNGYEKAQELGLGGTPAEKVAVLQTLTAQPIPLAELLFTLNFRGMLTKVVGSNEAEKWRGSILTMKAALTAANQTAYVAALDQWLSHITNPRNLTFDTTNPTHAATFAALNAAFGDPQAGIFQAGDFDAVYSLGGGRPYATLTVEQYNSQATAAESAVAKQELREYLNALEATFDRLKNIALLGINSGTLTTHEDLVAAVLVEGA